MRDSRNLIRNSASDLALALALLPRAKRNGMSALYAFSREAANVADDEFAPVKQRREHLIIGMMGRRTRKRRCLPEMTLLHDHSGCFFSAR
jgi:hypothetical protein